MTFIPLLAKVPNKRRAWTPASLSNVRVWTDFSDASYITKDGFNNVTAILDKSGTGFSYSNALTAGVWASGVQNGLGAVTFGGATRYTKVGAFTAAPTARCLLAVLKFTAITHANSLNAPGSGSDGYEYRGINSAGTAPGFDVLENGLVHHYIGGNISINVWHAISCQIVTAGSLGYPTGLGEGYIDGAISGSSGTYNFTYTSAVTDQKLFDTLDAVVGEMIITDSLLDAGTRASWFSYAKAKWGTP